MKSQMNKKIAFIHNHDYYIEYTTSEKNEIGTIR